MSCKADPCSCSKCLNKCMFFANLKKTELQLLDKAKTAAVFEKGEYIIVKGSENPHMLILTEGYAMLTIDGQFNRNFIIEVVKPTNVLNLMFMANQPLSPVSIIALTRAKVCYLDLGMCHQLMKRNAQFTFDMLVYLSQIGVRRYQRISSIAIKQTRGKLAETLLYLRDLFQADHITNLFSRKDLGDLANLSMENTIRTLKDFEKEGIISLQKKELQIRDVELLIKASDKG
jgi:CRP-like cAMP-binding protein